MLYSVCIRKNKNISSYNIESNCERNFAKIVEILDSQTAGRLSKQTSDPAYYIRDWLISGDRMVQHYYLRVALPGTYLAGFGLQKENLFLGNVSGFLV